MIDTKSLLTRAELASRLGLSTQTIRRYEKSGLLCSVKLGSRTVRYEEREIERFLSDYRCSESLMNLLQMENNG